MVSALYILLGFAAGILGGVIGIGGGILVVPVLVLLFHMPQKLAQGTTLAMLVPPVGLLAAYTYWKAGNADLKIAGLLCLGFLFGGLLGARVANDLPSATLEKVFGAALILIGTRMVFLR